MTRCGSWPSSWPRTARNWLRHTPWLGAGCPTSARSGCPATRAASIWWATWVNRQFQLDVFGEALLLLAAAARHDRLDEDAVRAARIAADAIAARWPQEDAGIWELDGQAWTHSRLICAAGLRAAAKAMAVERQAASWSGLADAIVADTAAHAVHPSGRWQRSPQDQGLDAALLLASIRGAILADDPRNRQTLCAYLAELTEDGYAYRFRHDERPLQDAEGAFLLCGFILALAAHQQGNEVDAMRWFERSRAACGPAGCSPRSTT
jgi:alpha,alpha-trehalase